MFFIAGDGATTSVDRTGNTNVTDNTEWGWDGALSRSLRGHLRLASLARSCAMQSTPSTNEAGESERGSSLGLSSAEREGSLGSRLLWSAACNIQYVPRSCSVSPANFIPPEQALASQMLSTFGVSPCILGVPRDMLLPSYS
jgi:hypothetical protein